jgi:hypothetical protein
MDLNRYAQEGEYYVRIETGDDIVYYFLDMDYDISVELCKEKNLPISLIRKWRIFTFEN